MSEDRLKLSTKKTLYPAIKIDIEVDGESKTYEMRKLTHAFTLEIEPVEESIADGDGYDAIVKWIEMLFGIPKKSLDKLA